MSIPSRVSSLGPLGLVLFFAIFSLPCVAQPPNQQTRSMGDAFMSAKAGEPVHIFYIHGIGSEAEGESKLLQSSICKYAKRYLGKRCKSPDQDVTKAWTRTYRHFADDMAMPEVTYMGKPVWTGSDLDWKASTPFVDRWEMSFEDGTHVILDELNWWPMMLAFKCRHILKYETELAGGLSGKNDYWTNDCSKPSSIATVNGVEQRTYMWQADKVGPGDDDLPEKPANYKQAVIANRWLKVYLMDWRFSDAILGLGPLERNLVEGIRALLEDSLSDDFRKGTKANYITVSHSLGSFLIFSALHLEYDKANIKPVDEQKLRLLLGGLSQAYFFANQIPLLELAKLGERAGSSGTADPFDLKDWSSERENSTQLKPTPCTNQPAAPLGEIVSWNDANDLLTWSLGKVFQDWQTRNHSDQSINGICVTNYTVKNAAHLFGVIELPGSAHDNYAANPTVIKSLLKPLH